jgi:hemerythrin HHE cation binding domain-containing protein
LFPLLGGDEAGDLQRTLMEHDALSAGARRLADALGAGVPDGDLLHDLGTLVREHIRREEYALYPAVLRAATKLNPG